MRAPAELLQVVQVHARAKSFARAGEYDNLR